MYSKNAIHTKNRKIFIAICATPFHFREWSTACRQTAPPSHRGRSAFIITYSPMFRQFLIIFDILPQCLHFTARHRGIFFIYSLFTSIKTAGVKSLSAVMYLLYSITASACLLPSSCKSPAFMPSGSAARHNFS